MGQPRGCAPDFGGVMLQVRIAHRFAGFSLDIAFEAPGGITALFGRSGAGKSTIVHAIAGLMRPDQGVIRMGDTTLLDTGTGIFVAPHRRRVGYVFQEGRLFPHLSVRQNLSYGGWFAPKAQFGPKMDHIVDLVGIGHLMDRKPRHLSGGEKQRTALARAILSRPEILLMDEPLAALDAPRKAEILPYLERLRDETRIPILYVSHSVAEIARLANTIVLMEAGRVTMVGPAQAVLSDPAATETLGAPETGAIVTAVVTGHDADGLSQLAFDGGVLWLAQVPAAPGTALRVRILAQDIMLARTRPDAISALNILACRVVSITPRGQQDTLIQLQAGAETLLARVTTRSTRLLSLVEGMEVFAIIKAVSVARDGESLRGPV
jgi:molybdate transport system ATP-binding protein